MTGVGKSREGVRLETRCPLTRRFFPAGLNLPLRTLKKHPAIAGRFDCSAYSKVRICAPPADSCRPWCRVLGLAAKVARLDKVLMGGAMPFKPGSWR